MTKLGHIWKEKWIKSQINPSSTQQILKSTFAIAAVSYWLLKKFCRLMKWILRRTRMVLTLPRLELTIWNQLLKHQRRSWWLTMQSMQSGLQTLGFCVNKKFLWDHPQNLSDQSAHPCYFRKTIWNLNFQWQWAKIWLRGWQPKRIHRAQRLRKVLSALKLK